MSFILYHSDCLDQLKQLEDNSIDSIVTDPPYGLSFMGKKWDYDVPSQEIWEQCLRVLKHGGHLLSFAGTRTQHRMAVRIEDAGFEIRDMIAWVYGSGFPKSHNLKDDWQGWGTALKPALEPITVARKPLVGTVAANVFAHGTGAINVDGCRVKVLKDDANHRNPLSNDSDRTSMFSIGGTGCLGEGRWPANLIHDGSDEVVGLFPHTHGHGSKEHSGSVKGMFNWGTAHRPQVGGESGSAARFFYCTKASKRDRDEGLDGFKAQINSNGDKWSDVDRRDGKVPISRKNIHPTVKPTDLMRYLCRLVTPLNGIVLDPFMGSGSTGKAAMLEGFQFVGIERDADYIEIAKARIEHAYNNKQKQEHIKQLDLL